MTMKDRILFSLACLLAFVVSVSAQKKISDYPNTATAANTDLFILARPGVTNLNQQYQQLTTQLQTNSPLHVTGAFGANIVPNGTFATDFTGWNGTNWTWNAGTALHTAGTIDELYSTNMPSAVIGSTYRVVFSMQGSVGSVRVYFGGVWGGLRSFTNTFTDYVTATATNALSFTPTSDFNGFIDNVSIALISNGDLTVDGVADFRSPVTIRNGISVPDGEPIRFGYNALPSSTRGTYNVPAANVAIGHNAGVSTTGGHITAVGYYAGYSNSTGVLTAFGKWAGRNNTSGHSSFFGNAAGYHNITGQSTCMGDESGSSNEGGNVTTVGYYAGYMSTNDSVTAVGYRALAYSLGRATAVGYNAGLSNRANGLTAVGHEAAINNTSGLTTAVGDSAAYSTTTSSATALGFHAGYSNVTGYITAIGHQAAAGITNSQVTAVGYDAMRWSYTGDATAVGYQSGYSNLVTGFTGVGYYAGKVNRTGLMTAVGHNALQANLTGDATAVGYNAGFGNTSGAGVFIGHRSGVNNTTGGSTLVGWYSGYANTTGDLIAIGSETGMGVFANAPSTDVGGILIGNRANRSVVTATKLTNYIAIGTEVLIDKSNQIKIGNANITETLLRGNVGINTDSPNSVLHVAGPIATSVAFGGTATLGATNSTYFCNVDAQTITLPTAASIAGRIYTIKLITPATVGTVTNATGAQTIDGALSYSLSASNKFVTVQSSGTNWWIIGNN